MSYETERDFNIIVTKIDIIPLKYTGICHIRAFANIVLNDVLMIRGLRVMESNNGLFLTYPVDPFFTSMDLRSIIVPVTRELREYIEKEVIKQYNKVVANG